MCAVVTVHYNLPMTTLTLATSAVWKVFAVQTIAVPWMSQNRCVCCAAFSGITTYTIEAGLKYRQRVRRPI